MVFPAKETRAEVTDEGGFGVWPVVGDGVVEAEVVAAPDGSLTVVGLKVDVGAVDGAQAKSAMTRQRRPGSGKNLVFKIHLRT